MGPKVRYEFLDHTSDAEFRAYGATLEEALVNAALAVAALMWDWQAVEPKLSRPVAVDGRDLSQLLVRYLEEVLYLYDSEGFVLGGVEGLRTAREDDRWRLEAVFRGDRASERYRPRGGVKAITYNELKIESGDGVTLQVVVDV